MKLTTHWHIKTTPHPDTPNYPDPKARHIYHTACALLLDPQSHNKTYALDQFNQSLVDCNRCLIWLSWLNELAPNPTQTKPKNKLGVK